VTDRPVAALRWLGHSTVAVDVRGVRVLTDPVLRRGVVHLRRRPASSPPEHSAAPQLVLLSHLHHDHCDVPSLRRLRPDWVVAPPGSAVWLQRKLSGLPTRVVDVAEGETGRFTLRGTGGDVAVEVTGLPAHHAGHRTAGWSDRAPARARAVEHLLRVPDAFTEAASNDLLVWAIGDTGEFDESDAVLAAAGRAPDVALVPVGGWGHTLGPHHLDPRQAADLVSRVGARFSVPVHWGTLHPVALSRTMGDRFTVPGRRFVVEADRAGGTVPVRLEVGGELLLDGRGGRVRPA
jgi:L-ascorbate metabolism protein UlaG (beta-lactamase superfamily)